MKKILSALLVLFVVAGSVASFAQATANDNTTTTQNAPADTGRQILREISVDSFDDPTLWRVEVPIDRGIAGTQRIYGGTKEKAPLRVAEQINDYNPVDNYVYGVRVDYFSRSSNTQIALKAVRPIYVPGVVKKLSVWVSGRGKNHQLSIIVRDMKGEVKTLPLGNLAYTGWKKLETSVPIEIPQDDINGALFGLYVLGFVIDANFEDTVGRYYIYFDDIRAVTDVLDETLRPEDDIQDGW